MSATDRAKLIILVLLSAASPIRGQSPATLVIGDSIRFDHLVQIDAFGPSRVARVRVTGSVLGLNSDTLTLRQSEQNRQYAVDRVSDLRVRRSVPNPGARGFKHGAIAGAAVFGATAFFLTMCNPDLDGGQGYLGPHSTSGVVQGSLVAAAVGALSVGLVGALLAPHCEWRKMSLSAGPTAISTGPTLSLRGSVSP